MSCAHAALRVSTRGCLCWIVCTSSWIVCTSVLDRVLDSVLDRVLDSVLECVHE